MDRVILQNDPQLFDKVIAEMQQGIADSVPWLDHVFGRAERLVKMVNGRKYYTPNVYVGGTEYMPVAPDSGIGNFAFFVTDDPTEIVDFSMHVRNKLKTPFGLIVWMDMRTVGDDRNTMSVKAELLHALNGRFLIRSGRWEISEIYERAENIYSGFSLDEINNQFLMHPYAGFRFDGTLYTQEECYD